ncbi:hypothetical protein AMTR_s00004p00144840 [Amborella trichopoda]|uniref:Uncharacterized protein n=1 Tax=Amborella trichopoda TaxID=13333 RepID=W1NES0_AMBTC|nr:hypothetical protein AMTR_s00004p00144840 [Amborella trichopoda]
MAFHLFKRPSFSIPGHPSNALGTLNTNIISMQARSNGWAFCCSEAKARRARRRSGSPTTAYVDPTVLSNLAAARSLTNDLPATRSMKNLSKIAFFISDSPATTSVDPTLFSKFTPSLWLILLGHESRLALHPLQIWPSRVSNSLRYKSGKTYIFLLVFEEVVAKGFIYIYIYILFSITPHYNNY